MCPLDLRVWQQLLVGLTAARDFRPSSNIRPRDSLYPGNRCVRFLRTLNASSAAECMRLRAGGEEMRGPEEYRSAVGARSLRLNELQRSPKRVMFMCMCVTVHGLVMCVCYYSNVNRVKSSLENTEKIVSWSRR